MINFNELKDHLYVISKSAIVIGFTGYLFIGIQQYSVTELKRGYAHLLGPSCTSVMLIAEGIFRAFGWQSYIAHRNLALLSATLISCIFTVRSYSTGQFSVFLGIAMIISGLILMKRIELFGQGIRGLCGTIFSSHNIKIETTQL